MKLITILTKTNRRIFFFIFLTALLTRIIVFACTDHSYIFQDSYTYHVLAVNLAKGNGYTASLSSPYEPNFTRDPAYPAFMSLLYRGYSQFHNLTITPYDSIVKNKSGGLLFFPGEMLWVILMQMFLASLSCIFFYLTLLYIFNPKYALLISLLFAVYFPYAYHDLYILRESFQSAIALIANYFFLTYVKSNKFVYIFGFGLLWGVLNLILQTSLIIGFIFPMIILICSGSLRKTIKATVIATFAMIVTVSPYLIRAYIYFPDTKIVRSMGCSITLEKRAYYATFIKLNALGYISQVEYDSLKTSLWSLPENETFERSFNGTFDKQTRELNVKYPVPYEDEIKYTLKNWFVFAGKTWFKNIYKNTEISFINSLKALHIQSLLPNIFSVVFGLLAFAGTILYFRYTYKVLLIFLSTVLIFFIIGDEARRSLPAHPYIFMFGVLCIINICFIINKIPKQSRLSLLFHKNEAPANI